VTEPLASSSAVAMDCSRRPRCPAHQASGPRRFDVCSCACRARRIVERAKVAVDARADEAVAREFFEFLAVLAFSPAHDGCENHDASSVLASSLGGWSGPI